MIQKLVRYPRRYVGFIVLICAVFTGVACCRVPVIPSSSQAVTPTPVAKSLGPFEPIEGTDYLIAPIQSSSYPSGSLGSSYSYSYRQDLYNYVFLNRIDETFYQLLPTNEYVIVTRKGLAPSEKSPVKWWLYGIVKSDTNGDKVLSTKDKITLAISDVGGKRYTEIITEVDQMMGDVFSDATTLLIIYGSNDKTYLARVDLEEYTVVSTKQLPSFGADVK